METFIKYTNLNLTHCNAVLLSAVAILRLTVALPISVVLCRANLKPLMN